MARTRLKSLRLGRPIDLGAMPLIDLTRFLACHLTDRVSEASLLFSTGLILEGLPSERHAAILRWVIDSKDAFFRYLRLLLSELGDPFAAALAAQAGSGRGAWRTAEDDAPLARGDGARLLPGRRSASRDRAADHPIGGCRRGRSRSRSRPSFVASGRRSVSRSTLRGALMPTERFHAAPALAPLKAFQRRTVDYVFDRFYGSADPVRQFLVADEVGLGKTMVARGVIARMIEHLWDATERIDILYICSNQAIAAQNLNRLNVLGRRELALPTRMTLIPLQLRGQAGTRRQQGQLHQPDPGHHIRSAIGDRRDAGARPAAAPAATISFPIRAVCITCCRSPPALTAGIGPSTVWTWRGSTPALSNASAGTCRSIAISSRNWSASAKCSRAGGSDIRRR